MIELAPNGKYKLAFSPSGEGLWVGKEQAAV